MLQLVQRDISEREQLINYVFKERMEFVSNGDS